MKNCCYLLLAALLFTLNSCTKDAGTISVTYYEATAVYGDLDEIRSQALNASSREISNPGKVYVAADIILIGEEGKGIHVIDNSVAATPTPVNFINLPGNREYFVKDNFLYGESYYDVVKLDISNPSQVTLVSRATNVFADGFTNEQGESLLGFEFEQVTKDVDHNSNLYKEINRQGNTVYLDFARNIIPQSAVPASFAGNSNSANGTVNRIAHHNEHVYIVGRYDLNIIKDDPAFEVVSHLQGIGEEMETIFPHKISCL